MFIHLEAENEKNVLFERIGALVQGGTSRSSTNVYGSHGAITGARNAIKTKAAMMTTPIHVRMAGRLRRSSRRGKRTRPRIECGGIHLLRDWARGCRAPGAIGTYSRIRGS